LGKKIPDEKLSRQFKADMRTSGVPVSEEFAKKYVEEHREYALYRTRHKREAKSSIYAELGL